MVHSKYILRICWPFSRYFAGFVCQVRFVGQISGPGIFCQKTLNSTGHNGSTLCNGSNGFNDANQLINLNNRGSTEQPLDCVQ